MNQSIKPSGLPQQPSQFSSPTPPESTSIPSRRPRWWLWIFGGLVIIALLCGGIIVVGGISLFQNSQSAATDAIKVVDRFLQAGARKDASAGFLLFSETVRDQQVTQEGIAKLFTEHKEYFADYSQVKQDSFNVTSGTNGVTASLEGSISYNGHPNRKFTATLVKEDNGWKLIGIRLLDELGK